MATPKKTRKTSRLKGILFAAWLVPGAALAATGSSASSTLTFTATVVPYPYELITPEIQKRICAKNPRRKECAYVLRELDGGAGAKGGIELMAPKEAHLNYDPERNVIFQTY